MRQRLAKFVRWLISVASERNGTGSASRVGMLSVVVSISLALISYVWMHHEFPSPEVLGGIAKIIASASLLYGANAYRNRNGDGPGETDGH